MRRLRTTWIHRGLVLLLVSSLLPVTFGEPPQGAQQSAAAEPHAAWLRSQVRTPMSDTERAAFESALQAASDAKPEALHAFLQHFVAAYAQQGGGVALATLLGLPGGTDQHAVNELQRRLARMSGWAAVPRLSTAPQAVSVSTATRNIVDGAVLAAPLISIPLRVLGTQPALRLEGRALVRALSRIRPRAP